MKKFGFSVYPEKAEKSKWIEYIELAAKYGFERIFSCLLSIDLNSKEKTIKEFKEINEVAKRFGIEVIVDVAPNIFNDLGINYKDLSFFKEIKADGIRLDIGFTGAEEALMTFNKENLLIEINMSHDTHSIDTIMDYMPNPNKLIGCHNFYPHNFTGLSEEHFFNTTMRFKQYGLRTAAFISSQEATFGPWPVTDGLPTVEVLRNLPLDIQAKYFIILNGLIDDVLISNCFASEEEMKKISRLNKEYVVFSCVLEKDIPEIEKKIVLEELHFRRGDINDNLIRSTMPRVKFKGNDFKVFNTPNIKRGDIIIESSLYGHYAGECQIALTDMPNSKKSNVVGHIIEEELFLLDYLKPWQKFGFIE